MPTKIRPLLMKASTLVLVLAMAVGCGRTELDALTDPRNGPLDAPGLDDAPAPNPADAATPDQPPPDPPPPDPPPPDPPPPDPPPPNETLAWIYVADATSLHRIRASTLAGPRVLEPVGSFDTGSEEMIDIAMDDAGRLFGTTRTWLWAIDPTTAATMPIVRVAPQFINALSFMSDGRLVGVTRNGRVIRIDPDAGTLEAVGSWMAGLESSGDLSPAPGGRIVASAVSGSDGSSVLVELDPVTFDARVLGPVGFGSVYGLATHCGHTYGFTAGGDLLEVDVTTGAAAGIGRTGINFYGAAATPAAAEVGAHCTP